MPDDLVTVLIPSFKPTYLRAALASVLTQTHPALEVLVGDNSGDPEIARIIESAADPRVTHLRSHEQTGGNVHANHRLLWSRASGRYVRFVYDDDLIYPRSTEVLLGLFRSGDGLTMTWHQRDVIDAAGQVRGRVNHFGNAPHMTLDRSKLLPTLVAFRNFIGEPSFCMFDRQVHTKFKFATHGDMTAQFLWDVVMFLNAAEEGPLAGSAEYLGGFRKHGDQISSSSEFAAVFGTVDWELIYRNELSRSRLHPDLAKHVLGLIAATYGQMESRFPVMTPFKRRLEADLRGERLAEATSAFNDAYRQLAASLGR